MSITNYGYGGDDSTGRLVDVAGADITEDDQRRAYIKIEGDNVSDLLSDVDMNAVDAANLPAILSELQSGYTKFSLLAFSDGREEKMDLMQTCGDSFIATFSGRKPHVMTFQGNLVFDYGSQITWYHAFINAYEYFLRASRMAKYRCKMRIVLPDCQEIVGYVIGLSTNHDSNNDLVVPMSLSMVVVDKSLSKPNIVTPAEGASDGTGGTGQGKSQDSVDGEAPGINDSENEALEKLKDHIPTKDEYAEMDALHDKIESGGELTDYEQERYNYIRDKVNNQGHYWDQYNQQKTEYYSRLQDQGKLTDAQANELMELQERGYYTEYLANPGSLPEGQGSSGPVAERDALYRSLLDKKSAGEKLTEEEAKQLAQFSTENSVYSPDAPTTITDPTPVNKDDLPYGSTKPTYDQVVQPDSPASDAVQNAESNKNNPDWLDNNAKTDPNYSSEQSKDPIAKEEYPASDPSVVAEYQAYQKAKNSCKASLASIAGTHRSVVSKSSKWSYCEMVSAPSGYGINLATRKSVKAWLKTYKLYLDDYKEVTSFVQGTYDSPNLTVSRLSKLRNTYIMLASTVVSRAQSLDSQAIPGDSALFYRVEIGSNGLPISNQNGQTGATKQERDDEQFIATAVKECSRLRQLWTAKLVTLAIKLASVNAIMATPVPIGYVTDKDTHNSLVKWKESYQNDLLYSVKLVEDFISSNGGTQSSGTTAQRRSIAEYRLSISQSTVPNLMSRLLSYVVPSAEKLYQKK